MRKARETQGWSQRELSHLIEEKYLGHYSVTHSTLSKLESGIYDNPRHNTLVAIASLKFIFHPLTNQPFTEDELSDIAAEVLDPQTGRYKLGEKKPTIATLIDLEIKNRPGLLKQLVLSTLATEAGLEVERLEAIYSGEFPKDEELIKLSSVLTKDNGTHWQETELWEVRSSQFPSQ